MIGTTLEETIESVEEIYKECSKANWDGYGANPVSRDSVFEATKFLHLIPSSFPMPQVVAEPSGEIGLEWNNNRGYVFAISFGSKNMIAYAGIFGNSKTHGTEYFGEAIPPVIIDNLRRLNQ
ncbi:MAG: hypothetical protein HZA16_00435 [Nitrospirae bacterium]|nr:hypothetical protein [Nitrospirota bacterium]